MPVSLKGFAFDWNVCPQSPLYRYRKGTIKKSKPIGLQLTWASIWDLAVHIIEDGYDKGFSWSSNFIKDWAEATRKEYPEHVVRQLIRKLSTIARFTEIPDAKKEFWQRRVLKFIRESVDALKDGNLVEPEMAGSIVSWSQFPVINEKSGNRLLNSWLKRWRKIYTNFTGDKKRVYQAVTDSFFTGWAEEMVEEYCEAQIIIILEMIRTFIKETPVLPEQAEFWNEVVLPFLLRSEAALRAAQAKSTSCSA